MNWLAGTQVIVGAASSSVSLKVIDKIASAGVVHVLACQHLRPVRLLPGQGPVLPYRAHGRAAGSGTRTAHRRGRRSARSRSWRSTTRTARAWPTTPSTNLDDAGIPADQIQKIIYDPNAQSFNAEVDQVKNFNPDAVAFIGFEESAKIITRMHEVGIGPSDGMAVYGVDGNMGNALGESVAQAVLDTHAGNHAR